MYKAVYRVEITRFITSRGPPDRTCLLPFSRSFAIPEKTTFVTPNFTKAFSTTSSKPLRIFGILLEDTGLRSLVVEFQPIWEKYAQIGSWNPKLRGENWIRSRQHSGAVPTLRRDVPSRTRAVRLGTHLNEYSRSDKQWSLLYFRDHATGTLSVLTERCSARLHCLLEAFLRVCISGLMNSSSGSRTLAAGKSTGSKDSSQLWSAVAKYITMSNERILLSFDMRNWPFFSTPRMREDAPMCQPPWHHPDPNHHFWYLC